MRFSVKVYGGVDMVSGRLAHDAGLKIRNKTVANNRFRIFLISLFLLTTSCLSLDPYKRFEDQLQAQVGGSIDDASLYSWSVQPELVFTKPLPGGHIEYHYQFENFRGLCRYVFEVDSTTRRIIDWRYDGEDKDKACFVVP
jgi:hypothetical protein